MELSLVVVEKYITFSITKFDKLVISKIAASEETNKFSPGERDSCPREGVQFAWVSMAMKMIGLA